MKIKFSRNYKKLDKNSQPVTVYVYNVSGSATELADYEAIQGNQYRANDAGVPLFFSTRYVGESTGLLVTAPNASGVRKVFADTSEMDKMDSLTKQYGGNFGQALAEAAAAKMVSGLTANAPVAKAAPAVIADEKSADL